MECFLVEPNGHWQWWHSEIWDLQARKGKQNLNSFWFRILFFTVKKNRTELTSSSTCFVSLELWAHLLTLIAKGYIACCERSCLQRVRFVPGVSCLKGGDVFKYVINRRPEPAVVQHSLACVCSMLQAYISPSVMVETKQVLLGLTCPVLGSEVLSLQIPHLLWMEAVLAYLGCMLKAPSP